MRFPWRRAKKVVIVPQPVGDFIRHESLTDREVDTIRAWSLAGMPTSPGIVLQLIDTLYHARGEL